LGEGNWKKDCDGRTEGSLEVWTKKTKDTGNGDDYRREHCKNSDGREKERKTQIVGLYRHSVIRVKK